MPAHDIAQANREKLGTTGMDKIVAFDETGSLDNLMPLQETNQAGTLGNSRATSAKNAVISMLIVGLWCARRDSNPHDFTHCHLKAARLPIPPRALGKTAPGTERPGRINGVDVTNQCWRDKACCHP